MLSAIPTHLIAGPLGAGKTSLLRQLLSQRPADERWAVLINEFGQVGVDAALLAGHDPGISFSQVAGGCLCCVNGLPFQVGLGRLLRKARPHRLFIEPSGLGHPAVLLEQLGLAPWSGVLALQPPLLVLDAAALARGEKLPETQREVLDLAGLVLLNKSETLDSAARTRLQALFKRPLLWTSQGQLSFSQLPLIDAGALQTEVLLPEGAGTPVLLWRNVEEPICQIHAQDNWSIGWRWHSSQRFDRQRVQGWLQAWSWLRAKLVLHSDTGWLSVNLLRADLQGEAVLPWRRSEWRKDSRVELIFSEPQDEIALQAALQACRL